MVKPCKANSPQPDLHGQVSQNGVNGEDSRLSKESWILNEQSLDPVRPTVG